MSNGSSFLSFNQRPPRLYITADEADFDELTVQSWRDEGFDVLYLPYNDGGKAYASTIRGLPDEMELGEVYAIIAYGDAAAAILDLAIKPLPHCAAIIAYYPTKIASPNQKYPTQVLMLAHLAASQGFSPSFPSYTYQGVQPGFAETDLDEYDKIAADLAWTRSLRTVRKGFKIDVDLEKIREEQVSSQFIARDPAATMKVMVPVLPRPYVNYVPTMTGGIGKKELQRFYHDFFIPCNPKSFGLRLISRTTGVDRVIDELVVSFRHTQEMPWILPGVPHTDKLVQIAMVSIVCIRGGKLYHEHLYWDQASVLVQIGLLDPKMVPKPMASKGMERLPVHGIESAKKILDEESQPSNELIPDW